MTRNISLFIAHFLLIVSARAGAQTVQELQKYYSGTTHWNAQNATLTFESSGKLEFDRQDTCFNYFWNVPNEVKKIVINENTTVTAGFHTYNDCIIEGENRKTSVIYGTPEQSWANNRKIVAWKYSHILNHGGVLRINNLSMINPYSFFVRSFNQLAHIRNCDFIDYRGGHHNHSDGFAGGDGSTVDNCYFATGDDAIKLYADMTVTNTTIEMITNCVPIQLGWGNYSDGAVGTFKNLTIIGEAGRNNSDMAVISGRKGKYEVTVNIDGCEIKNPNAVLVSLWDETMTLNGEIKNARINVRAYSDRRTAGTDNLVVCGAREKKSKYNCK
ncbi:hypothetical protein [Draconibacterium sediminis]|uniref:Right handed beta helix domain-containing protein n=1 Tax=Draconibacterium sediminis TaxID=1544798 RepID=A0A0D8JHI9_9BACT|nr:hypothetical protein [Draconibacterium sediminis]KJF45303.1 hypothetical protein LH29_07955 [Draconibacterium sediminis]